MLVKKPSLIQKIAAIKLTSGEEILGKVTNEEINFITIDKPVMMVMTANPDAPDQAVISFVPWMLGIRDNQPVTIEYSKIIFAAESRGDASDQYRQAVGEFDETYMVDEPGVKTFDGAKVKQKEIINSNIIASKAR